MVNAIALWLASLPVDVLNHALRKEVRQGGWQHKVVASLPNMLRVCSNTPTKEEVKMTTIHWFEFLWMLGWLYVLVVAISFAKAWNKFSNNRRY